MNVLPIGRRVRRRRGGGGRAAASGALLLAVLAGLVGQAGPAQAVGAPPTPTASPQAGAAAEPSAEPSASPNASPSAGTDTKAAAPPDRKADQEAAAHELRQADPSGPCPATLQPNTVASCTLDQSATAAFSLTLPQQKDLLLVQIVTTQGSILPTVVAPDGTTVSCDDPVGPSWDSNKVLRCATTQAGTYTLKVGTVTGSPTGLALSYLPLQSTTACRAVGATDLALGAPTVFHGSLALGSAGDCYQVNGLSAGDVLRTDATQPGVTPVVYDATGAQVCGKGTYPDCPLTGTAPFRITVQRYNGAALTYDVSTARLSHPEGCTLVEPQAYGVSPDLTSTTRCRTLRVPESARYGFGPVKNDGSVPGKLFTADGTSLGEPCAQGACDLTPGDYTWAVDAYVPPLGTFGMAFHSAKETRGCVAANDTGLTAGPATGTFGGPGQQLCLTLPTASGKGVYLLNRPPADGATVDAQVLDASGAKQCEISRGSSTTCKLTGTVPFRAVLTGTPSKAYGLVVHRTEEAGGCTAWPQSGFDGTWGVEVPLTAAAPQACLSLPADKHSTTELIDYANLKNQLNAELTVFDAAGAPVCTGVAGGNSASTCRLAANVPYTALLNGSGGADTYRLARHDISPSANCLTPTSTTVGGPGISFDLTSALDARCVRVTAASSDKYALGVRTSDGAYGKNALLSVVDIEGKPLCTQFGSACQLTGAGSYTAVVLASGYTDKPIRTSVDAWKVHTAAGWAPECAANQIAVEGFPQRSRVLTDDSTAYCAVIDMKANQSFAVVGTSSATGPIDIPRLRLLRDSRWSGDYGYQCSANYGAFGGRCSSDSQAEQAVLILSSATAGTPVEYSMQGVCDSACPVPRPQTSLTSVSPSSGAAGTRVQAVIHGKGLHLGRKAKLVGNGPSGRSPLMETLSVNADGTALDVLLDTNGLQPGSYGVELDGVYGVSLPNAFTVTAPAAPTKSRFVPITPARFLDTRDGTGAPAERVGPGGVVSLQVAGVKGVPTTGVTAVVMNVTAVEPTSAGHLTVYPDGRPLPDVSNLNFEAGQIVPNLVTVPVVNGKVDLRNNAGSVDLIADVTGYYTDGATGSALTTITPARFLDTRDGTGAPAERVGPGGVVSLQVAGVKGVPTTGVTAVVMNVTAVEPTSAGHLTVYPDGRPLPDVSNLNFEAGQIVANLVTVPVVNGKIDLRNNAGSVDLIADVTGYYGDSGSAFSPTTPVRLLDTRNGVGARAGTVGSGGIVSLPVTAIEGVPATGVTAVVLNVTVTEPTAASHLIVYPHGTARPDVSNLNFTAGQTRANLVVVPVVDGRVTLFNHWGDAHVIADLNGYFTA
ncbi:hypothetical protein P3T27_006211 [Kitasatospora sp. MAA19]|uniref:hypothetical protein n=1 Tax=Kitasatospora sp. MAA19 TaxID=3035090 RepID=UPI00247678A7|nr:hypothetical protein [Kitasatospora sp. MAA19]MDH6709463.1 hypothetical protein [Kitasatospora sp. MAA19]